MVVLNVLIVGIAYADKKNMNSYTEWFDKSDTSDIERRRLVGGGIRELGLTAAYSLLDLDKFTAHILGHTPNIMVDYGAADGRVGFNLAVAMDVGSLITVNGKVDDLIESSTKVSNATVGPYEVPNFDKKPDLFVLNDVVSWMSDSRRALEMFSKMADQLSENGVILVVQTDIDTAKIKNVTANFEHIKATKPDLLRKILFVLPKESSNENLNEDIVMSAFDGDLASQLNTYRTELHDKEFVIEGIRQT